MKILTLILLTCSITCHLWADNLSNLNGGFNNLGSKTKTLSVRCFTQDSTGMVCSVLHAGCIVTMAMTYVIMFQIHFPHINSSNAILSITKLCF